jgi:hypothetical protein
MEGAGSPRPESAPRQGGAGLALGFRDVHHMLIWLDGPLGLALLILLLLVALGWYLSYLAARLDRLHHRVESSRAALETRLARRAAAALEVGRMLGPPDGTAITAAANRALSGPAPAPRHDVRGIAIMESPIAEPAENDLARALHRALADPERVSALRADPASATPLAELVRAGERVRMARRFHNDAVAHAQRMRRKRVVRWARLAGRARLPQMVEIDDSDPAGLGPQRQ